MFALSKADLRIEMYRCGDYKWQTKNVLIEWKKPLEKDIDIFANSSLSLYVSIFRMELRWYCQLKTKTFFLSFEKYVKYEQENTYQHWWNEHTNSFKFSWWFSQKKTTTTCKLCNYREMMTIHSNYLHHQLFGKFQSPWHKY